MKQFASFKLDMANECLWQDGVQIALQPKPFAVLRYLVEHPGRLITHDELLDALWPNTFVQPQVLRTYMLELRKILGDDAGQPRFIQTLPKRGYCFMAAVTEAAGPLRSAMGPAPEKAHGAGISIRGEERALLDAEIPLVAGGERRVVLISGEAGMGKTALVDAFTPQAVSALAAALARGQCVPGLGGKEQFYPVMEALSHLCASPHGEAACRVLARMAPEWLVTLGRHPEASADSVTHPAARERVTGNLCAALEELAADKPLILLFEDAQWADHDTLNLISALARRRAPAKLLILVTYRPLCLTAGHPLKALKQDLLMRRLCAEIVLKPLAKFAVLQVLARELGQDDLSPELGTFVHRHAEGNPLFAILILRHLIAQRILVRPANNAARWELAAPSQAIDAGVPEELSQMVELEIERLPPEEQRILEAGSLMNFAFPAWAVAAALDRDAAEIEEACDGLARSSYLLERAGQDELPDGSHSAFYVFTHGLYREVLYQRQTAARRARWHIRIAGRLGELFAGREACVAREMALHYEAAESWLSGALALRAAAHYAAERGAHGEAIELLERALRISVNLSTAEREGQIREMRGALQAARDAMRHRAEIESEAPIKV